jgi:hypothetical protein
MVRLRGATSSSSAKDVHSSESSSIAGVMVVGTLRRADAAIASSNKSVPGSRLGCNLIANQVR